MKYYEVTFILTPNDEAACDILSALAGSVGFESFVFTEEGVKGYIQQHIFNSDELDVLLADFPMPKVSIFYQATEAEDKNWNEEWEQNGFEPICINNDLVVHSTNHTHIPEARYQIKINPCLAFGTGSHQTTYMIMQQLLTLDLTNQSVLDAGCGTGVLAILSSLRGANPIMAYDIDEWSVKNTLENISLNDAPNIEVKEGDSSVIAECKPFDVILANINRNILLADISRFTAVMKSGSLLIISGFYTQDIPVLKEKAEACGLTCIHSMEKENWASLQFRLL